jgi:lysophospholipase L1-like esterase
MVNKIKLMAVVIAIMLLGLPIGILQIINFQNAKSLATSQSIPVRVACVGDSITQTSGYTYDLQSLLGPEYSVGNFGVTGSTVSLDSYKPYMKQPEFAAAQDFAPDIVVVMLGTNDAHYDLQQNTDSFEDDYVRLTESFENLSSSPQVLIVKSPPVYNNSLGIDPTYFSDNIIPHIQDVANQQNLPTVDVYDAFGNHSDYTVDGIHPNSDGTQLIATQIYDLINFPR